MFSDFENMFSKIKNSTAQVINNTATDHAHTPQKYSIAGREIQQVKLLSEGAFGFIWLAQDIKTKEKFALKRVICMTADRLQEAQNEKTVLALLPKSDNIVKYFGGDVIVRQDQKTVITLMELCSGGTLFDLLQKKENKGFTEQELVDIMTQVIKGLQSIHTTGYYHRDVKIQNVLLGNDKRYKLCDFGSATKEIFDFSKITKANYDSVKESIEALTTPMYRPPQIVDPYLKYTVDKKADIWMAGCVLYTLCYFTHPFLEANAIGISSGTYRFPNYPQQTKYKVSEKLKDLIRHLLTPNPSFRPSCQQVLTILGKWSSLSSIPLNSEAIERKQKQKQKQKELALLNKKCVDFDGDIPLQKLIELQNKVKIKQGESSSSFLKSSKIAALQQKKPSTTLQQKTKSVPQNNLNQRAPIPSSNSQNKAGIKHDPFSKQVFAKESKSAKQPVTSQKDIWGNGFGIKQTRNQSKTVSSSSSPSNSFEFFNSFGSAPKISQQQTKAQQTKVSNNNINFQQMFMDTPVQQPSKIPPKPSQVKVSDKTQKNLLDF